MTDDPTVLQVVTTTDSRDEAQRLAAGLIERRLAACAQVDGPIESTYWWDGKAATDPEYRLTIKTTAERYPTLEEWLTAEHSYEVPEILATPVQHGLAAYVQWVIEETRAAVV